ncbi:hypothetical protein PINS_up012924 [Pythium insidiosum]|nr:hypothetical protein PINS_up012924 [Pythium insidiosum]
MSSDTAIIIRTDLWAPTNLDRPPPVALKTPLQPHRITLYFQDEDVRKRSEKNASELLRCALTHSTPTNNSTLATKALRYRHHLSRMSRSDVLSAGFDASKFLGVDWCKTSSLKAHCRRQP